MSAAEASETPGSSGRICLNGNPGWLLLKKLCHRILVVVGLPVMCAVLGSYDMANARPEREPCCGPITAEGDSLAATLDRMNVESLWLSHEHVNWQTGEPDRGGVDEGEGHPTHCSAFAASAAKKLGVYLLRPPEHGQVLLANAQA